MELHFYPDRSRCFDDGNFQGAGIRLHGKMRQESHAYGEEEIHGMDRGKPADPEVLKPEELLFGTEIFFDPPAGKVRPGSQDHVLFGRDFPFVASVMGCSMIP